MYLGQSVILTVAIVMSIVVLGMAVYVMIPEKYNIRKRNAFVAISKALEEIEDDDKLDLLERQRYEISKAMHIHESKMTNGTQGERVACKALGLKWNSEGVHGCDGWDADGYPVELKCFKSSATRANVSYVFPKRNTKESDDAYASRVYMHFIDNASGGHYWVMLSKGSTRYQQHWKVDNARFAEAMKNLLLSQPKKVSMNFGCSYCKDCKLPHRLIEITRILNDKTQPVRLPAKVAQRCYGTDVKITY